MGVLYDTIIIGAGAAGITAAIYAARANLKFEIISKDIGGLTLWSPEIQNYTGYYDLSGIELIQKFQDHLAKYKIEPKEEAVISAEKKGSSFIVKTDMHSYETKTVIICSGSSPRRLNVKGADNLEGKGLAYCATCDGPLFTGKDVAVIGGGDSAISAAVTLIQMARKIYLLTPDNELKGTDAKKRENVLKNPKVTLLSSSKVNEIVGDDSVKGLRYEQSGNLKALDVEGVFVEIGHIRNVGFAKNLIKLNEKDEIITDKSGSTSAPGIFAAGDVTDMPGKQTIISCGDGARALLSAFSYLSKGGKYA